MQKRLIPVQWQVEKACKEFLQTDKGFPKELRVDKETYALLDRKEYSWRNDDGDFQFRIPVKAAAFLDPTVEFVAEGAD